jgi:hypothetical protein
MFGTHRLGWHRFCGSTDAANFPVFPFNIDLHLINPSLACAFSTRRALVSDQQTDQHHQSRCALPALFLTLDPTIGLA